MESKHSDFGIIFFLHLFLILIFWFLPFLVTWKLVFLAVLLYYVNRKVWKVVYGLCPLTIIQFKTKNPHDTFYHYYLTKYIGLSLDKRKTKRFVTWVVPAIIFAVSLVWQILLGIRPLII